MLRELGDKYRFTGIASAKTRKAGRKVFLTVCYRTDDTRRMRELDEIRKQMADEVRASAPEMDVEIHFSS